MRTGEAGKRAAAEAALALVRPGSVVGVGTGSTAAYFIEGLPATRAAGAVSSSVDTTHRLLAAGMRVVGLEEIGGRVEMYVDGADQVDPLLRLIKGAGGAMAREKVVASAADRFVCIVDETKVVTALGGVPLPVEVLPMARAYVQREIDALGGVVAERALFVTDNGNVVLDVDGLDLSDPEALESILEALPGVVGCGLFARRRADSALVGAADGTFAVLKPRT